MGGRRSIGVNGAGMLFPTGTAYIAIPEDLDRTSFIKRCVKTQTVFIRGESGEAFKNVFISKSALRDVEWPETSSGRGSTVIWVKQPKHNVPMIVGILDLKDSISAINKERQIKLQKRSKSGNVVDIDGSADDASLDITVSASDDSKGIIRFKVSNPTQDAKMEVYVSGNVNVFADKQVRIASNEEILVELVKQDGTTLANFSYKNGVGFALKDEYDNEVVTKSKSVYLKEGSSGGLELEVTDSKINLGTIGGSAEPGVLGDKNASVLSDIESCLNDIKTTAQNIGSGDQASVAALASLTGITLTYPTIFSALVIQLTAILSTMSTNITNTKSTKVKTD